jgi:AbrB family looped-hinge helix DNA binding protein
MNTTVKIQDKGQVTIPTSVRRQARISKGDLVSIVFTRGQIVITPKLVIDRSRFPNADGDYTPAQRRAVDARLAKSDDDIRRGRVQGPFSTAEAFVASLHDEVRKLGAKKSVRPAR